MHIKKGFTLIELLAVIVILAILAVIVSPIISGVISDAKKASAERSTEGYIKAVEYAQVQYQYKNKGSITQSIENLSISAQGKDKVTVTSIEFNKSGIVISATISVDGYTCNYSSGKANCSKDSTLSIPVVNAKTSTELINLLKEDADLESGLVADSNEPGRYYFRGKDPKNKILLKENDSGTIKEVDYRIISFEADGTIKVVREDRIIREGENTIAWDSLNARPTASHSYCNCTSSWGCNAWGNMNNTYRNGALMDDYFSLKYYASNTATSMTITGTNTKVTKDSSLNEYLNGSYLTINLAPILSYIDNHTWDVGGVYYASGKSFEKDIEETKVNTWIGYVALPSIIDFKNASDNITQCINIASNVCSNTYYFCLKNSDGIVNNYLYKSYTQWSLSAAAHNRWTVWYVGSPGCFSHYDASSIYCVRPSFYLKSIVKLTGEGIEGNEFKIAES